MEDSQMSSNQSAAKKVSRVSLPLDKKIQVIKEHQNSGKSMRALASQFQCGRSQIKNIVKRQHEWLEAYADNPSASQKRRPRHTRNDEVNFKTLEWLKETIAQDDPITGPLVKEKALLFAKQLGIMTFKASNGWLESFRKRHGISFSKPLDFSEMLEEGQDESRKKLLSTICDGFALHNIYVAYEVSIFFKASIEFAVFGIENDVMVSNEEMTVFACSNALGNKEKLVVIGKPSRFHTRHSLDCQVFPVDYHSSAGACLTTTIFDCWLKQFNEKVSEEKRKVVLLMDNAFQELFHSQIDHVTVKFLPNLSTSPYDDIVKDLKLKFRLLQLQYIVRKVIVEQEKSGPKLLEETSLLHAIWWVQHAWKELEPANISSWFHKAGLKGLEEIIRSQTEQNIGDLVLEDQLCVDFFKITLEEVVELDSVIEACIHEYKCNVEEECQSEQETITNSDVTQAAPVSPLEAFHCIEKLKLYLLQNCETQIFDNVMAIEMEIDQAMFKKFKVAREGCSSE